MVGSSRHLAVAHVGEHRLQHSQGIQLVEEGGVFTHVNGNLLEVCLGPPPAVFVVGFGEAIFAIGALVLGIHFIEKGSEITRGNCWRNESSSQKENGQNPFYENKIEH